MDAKLPALHNALLSATETLLSGWSSSAPDPSLEGLDCAYWDRLDPASLATLQPVVDLLLSGEHRAITELNLTVANGDTNWQKHPVPWAVADYLNDLLGYTVPRLVSLEHWRDVFEQLYESFEREYFSDSMTLEVFGHLGNFSYQSSDFGELNDHARIVVLSPLRLVANEEYHCGKWGDFFRVKTAIAANGRETIAQWHTKSFLLYQTLVSKREFSGRADVGDRAYEVMRKFILAVRVLSPSHAKPYCDFAVIFHHGRRAGSMRSPVLMYPEDRVDHTGWVSFEWPNWLRKLWTQLEGTDYTARLLALDYHVDDSLKRGHRSARNPHSRQLQIIDELERLSDYFSAFDSIYNTKPGDTGKQIAVLTAKLMTHQWGNRRIREPGDYQSVRGEVLGMYRIRNDYEHGRTADALEKAKTPQAFKERVRLIGYYLKQAAIIYIMNRNFDSQIHRVVDIDCSDFQHVY